ncbi:MAG: hypothetical protein JJ956_09440 [Pseudomonadales bacterium]|nr:hypothetical protein [Pseudomonadales bacterium]
MSVLLDALKRAALDKKKGQSEAGIDAAAPTLNDAVPEPAIPEPTVSESESESLLDESVFEESLEAEDDAFTELFDDEGWDTEELEELVSDIDPDSETNDLEVDESEVDGLITEHEDPEFEARKEKQELQFALMQAEEKREQERLEREYRQAEAAREQERLRQEAKTQRLFEEEAIRREKEEAEKEARKNELLEEARKQAEEDEKRRAENETSLTTLVHEGHAINKRQKQRARFLYAVLTLTAGFAIIAYYIYLLGSQSDVPLRERLEDQVVRQETSTPPSTLETQSSSVSASGASSAETENPFAEPIQTEPVQKVPTFLPIESLDLSPSSDDLNQAFTKQEETGEPESATVSNESVARDQEDGGQEVVHVYHKAVPTKLSDTVNRAYQSYQRGDLNKADLLYRQALRSYPRNRDALLGAAAVAVDRGAFDEAARLYQIRLNDNPADSHARSALLALSSQTDFASSDIDQMIDASPQDAHLYFLKGYAHALNGDWLEAQAAFFDAHHWDQANADYAFNLAVSLDHLGQQSAAVRFYRQAIDLAQERKGAFSIDQARQRLAQIESAH